MTISTLLTVQAPVSQSGGGGEKKAVGSRGGGERPASDAPGRCRLLPPSSSLPSSFSRSLSPSLSLSLFLCIHLSLSFFCLAICALFSSLPPHSICSLCLSELYLSISVWTRALGQRWVGVSVFLILFMPLSHPYFYTRSQRLSFFLSVCVCV